MRRLNPPKERKPPASRRASNAPAPEDLDVEIVVAEGGVIAILSHALPTPARTADREALTESERTIAALARAGLTDRAIAAVRGVTRSTVTKQLAEVFRKLGVRSRRELIACAIDATTARRR